MGYDYKIALEVLGETEKNRMVCAFLNSDQASINWDKATQEFGAASVASMRRCVYNSLKKIEDAGGKEGVAAAPAKDTPKKATGKKREAAEDGGSAEATPTPKKRGRKPKAATTTTPAQVKNDDEAPVKGEDDFDTWF